MAKKKRDLTTTDIFAIMVALIALILLAFFAASTSNVELLTTNYCRLLCPILIAATLFFAAIGWDRNSVFARAGYAARFLVLAAFIAASCRDDGLRFFAAFFACFDRFFLEAAERPSRFNAFDAAQALLPQKDQRPTTRS
jgi:hypothetical protein